MLVWVLYVVAACFVVVFGGGGGLRQVWDVSDKPKRNACGTKLVDVAKTRGVKMPEVSGPRPRLRTVVLFH